MLVVSRRQNESILFPNLGIKVQVVRLGGKAVRLGVQAPAEVRVLREEIAFHPFESSVADSRAGREERHAIRNRLNTVGLALRLLQRHLELGQTEPAESLINKVLDELHQVDAQLGPQRRNEAAGTPLPKRRVLIVEDNVNEAQLLAEYLRMSGYEVYVTPNGVGALDYLRQDNQPDFVLLDMNMPELGGPETIHRIRSEPALRGLKLFGVSGADQGELGVTIGDQGLDRWFSKPVDARKLVQEMNRELAGTPLPA